MIGHDDTNFSTIIDNGGHYEWAIKRSDASEYIEKENIVRGTIQSTMFDKLSIGMVVAAQLNLTLWDVEIDPTASLEVLFRATDGTNHSYWHSRGVYYIDKLKASPYSKFVEIVAYDAMLKTETDFAPDGNYVPMSARDCALEIATNIGVALGPSTRAWMTRYPKTLTNAPHVGVGGTTYRDMLSYIGVLYGANWAIYHDRLEMLFPQYTETDYRAEVGNGVTTLDRGDMEYVTRVRLWLDAQTSFRSPSNLSESEWNALGGRCIEADLPFYATQAAADFILSEYTGRSYVPYNATKVFLDPRHEINDPISFADGNIEFASKIVNQTITMDALAPSDLRFDSEDIVDSYYPYISSVVRNTLYEIGQAQTMAGNANAHEQTIYKSAPSGTNSLPAYTTWVTNAAGGQGTWTTTRPVYDSAYPVLFVATQRQSMDQAGGTVCTCTTPVKDQTTTVIDGGHITTGTIDASVVNVTNINADNIETGTLTGVTISGNTISGNTITGGTISGTTITGSTLTSATANGSVQIANGNINFFKNATTTGTPFSQIKHTVDSAQGDSIEWSNSGYTKLVNTGGGQWTADFVQFALGASNPVMQMQIYPDSDGTHTKLLSDWIDINGNFVPRKLASTADYFRFVVALCKSYNGAVDSWWSGRVIYDRQNGVIAPYYADVVAHNRNASGAGWLELKASHRNGGTSKTDTAEGWRPCTFVYNNETYAGIEGYFTQAAPIYIFGCGSFAPFAIHYYNTNTSQTLNSEVFNSLNFSGTSEFLGNSYQYKSTTFTPSAANAWQQVPNLTLTAPCAGLYAIYAQGSYNNGSPLGIAIVVRNSTSTYTDWAAVTDRSSTGLQNVGTTQNLKTSCIVPLGAGDVASVYAKYSSATNNGLQLRMYLMR